MASSAVCWIGEGDWSAVPADTSTPSAVVSNQSTVKGWMWGGSTSARPGPTSSAETPGPLAWRTDDPRPARDGAQVNLPLAHFASALRGKEDSLAEEVEVGPNIWR